MPSEFHLTGGAFKWVADSADAGTEPDLIALAGTTIEFVCNIPLNKPLPTLGAVIFVTKRTATIASNGQILDEQGNIGIDLLGDDPGFQLTVPVQWLIKIQPFMHNGKQVRPVPYWINAPAPGQSRTIDELTPVPGVEQPGGTRGPRGWRSRLRKVMGGGPPRYQWEDEQGVPFGAEEEFADVFADSADVAVTAAAPGAVASHIASAPTFTFDADGYPVVAGTRTPGPPLDFLPGGLWGSLAGVPKSVDAVVGTGIDRTGTVDSSAVMAAQLATPDGTLTIPPGTYNLAGWVTPTITGGNLTIVGSGRVRMIGSGQDFLKVTGGSVTVQNIEFDGFRKLFAFDEDSTNYIDAIVADNVKFANSMYGGLISYFPAADGVRVGRMRVRACEIHDCRQGVHFRGRAAIALARDNEIYNTQNYSIRFGQDWSAAVWQGSYRITNNDIHDQHNPISGSGHEANMIAVFGNNAVISGNTLTNLTNVAGQGDCEGIYLKSRQFSVSGNVLTDVGLDEGAIIVKGHPMDPGGARDGGTITGNVIRFLVQRAFAIGINLLRGDVTVSGNQVSGAAVNGIRISWRGAYQNIDILNNSINNMDSAGATSGGAPLAAILLFGYGRNINVKGNSINGAYQSGIRLENNASGTTRYPTSDWTPIRDGYSIENNTIDGKGITGSRGISIGIDATEPLDNLRIVGNKVRGFAEWDIYISAALGCDNWVYDRNEISSPSMVRINSWPSTIYLGGIEWSAQDVITTSALTKTVNHTIPSAGNTANPPTSISSKLTAQDVVLTPRAMGAATKLWVSAISSGSVQAACDVAPGTNLTFGAKVAFNRVVTTVPV